MNPINRVVRSGALVALLLYVVGRFLRYAVPLAGCLLVGLLVAVLAGLVAELAEPALVAQVPGEGLADGGRDQPFVRIAAIEDRFGWSVLSPRYLDATIGPWLTAIAAERLHRLHGVDLTRQPDRARALMGEELWLLASGGPVQDGPGWPPERTARLVDAIEAL